MGSWLGPKAWVPEGGARRGAGEVEEHLSQGRRRRPEDSLSFLVRGGTWLSRLGTGAQMAQRRWGQECEDEQWAGSWSQPGLSIMGTPQQEKAGRSGMGEERQRKPQFGLVYGTDSCNDENGFGKVPFKKLQPAS